MNEKLVPMTTVYGVAVSAEARPDAKVESRIVSNEIRFGRQVNGVDVIGPGLKIAITFGNDETPVGFTYDWPEYESTGMTQKAVGKKEIIERASALATMRFPAKEVDMERFECGYWDPGANHRDPKALIQAGCAVAYVGRRYDKYGEEEVDAVADAIPVGKVVVRDDSSPHARAHREMGDICRESVLSKTISEALSPPATLEERLDAGSYRG